ncbi:MAG: hypothetical protein M0Z36_04260 [Thermaerobacter sp.]|nr:hypothetical protein [Thermaerobacter sp.]
MLLQTLVAAHLRLSAVREALLKRDRRAVGGTNISTIIWIVIGVLVSGGVSLWLTAGGGITAIKALLTSITSFFNQSATQL